MSKWRPLLRLARRDAQRHLTRTLLSALLISMPIIALTSYVSLSTPGMPTRDRVLATIPDGAQAVITATTIPRENPPFKQLPEGAPGPWIDDSETLPATSDEIVALLTPGTVLTQYWHSPPLVASANLDLEPGEQRSATTGTQLLNDTPFARMATVELHEAESAAFELLAPEAREGRLPTDATEVLVSRDLATRVGVDVGDTIGFVAPPDSGVRSTDGNAAAAMQDSLRGYRVSGITEETGYTAWAPAGWLSTLVSENPAGVQGHWLALGDEPVTWDQAKSLNGLQVFAISRHVLHNYPSADELYPVQLPANVYLETAIGLVLVFVVGGLLMLFLVTPALAISAEQSRRTLGLASAIGASSRDLRRIVLSQGLVIGSFGAVLGAVLGLATALGFSTWLGLLEVESDIQHRTYGFDIALAHFPWWTLVSGVPLAIALGLVAALAPARMAARLAPIEALRDRRPVPSAGRQRLTFISGVGLLTLSMLLGATTFLLPLPEYPTDPAAAINVLPRTNPPGSDLLTAFVGFTVIAAALGLVFTIRALVPRIGRFGSRSHPIWRLTLRDAADHPSRTAPAVLGIVFSLLAASYLLVLGASEHANMRTTSANLDWLGTFMVSPRTQINPAFDRALTAGIFVELEQDVPEVTGTHAFEALARESSIWLEPVRASGRDCPDGEMIHASSAREIGAPLHCVNQLSGAQYSGGIRVGGPFSTWMPPLLIDGATLLATRIDHADAAAELIDAGGVLVSDASLIDASGTVLVAAGPPSPTGRSLVTPERIIRLPVMLLRGIGADFILSPDTARSLGVDKIDFVGLLAETSKPIDSSILPTLWQQNIGELAYITIPDDTDQLGASTDPTDRAVRWGPIVLLALIAIATAAISVLLSATQGRRDAATAHAVGANRGMIARLGLAQALLILAIGVPVGMSAGIGLGAYQVAWNRRLEASGAWLDTVIAWDAQVWIVVAVTGVGLLVAFLLTRPPRQLTRRRLD